MNSCNTFILFLLVLITNGKELPPPLVACAPKDPNFGKCIQEQSQKGIQVLSQGLPDYNVKSIKTIDLGSFEIGNDNSQIGLKQLYKNAKLQGLSEVVVKQVRGNLDKKCQFLGEYFTPYITFLADYQVSGRILVLPIQGEGKSNVTITDVEIKNLIKCERYEKNGETYVQAKEFKVQIEPKNAYIVYENLFNGDKHLSETMNTFINENWKEIFAEMKPYYEKIIGEKLRAIINNFMTDIPEKKLFAL